MFGPFERKIAARYLRARRGERFVSVIAIFSLIGIMLGVATLIIVTSVMNGFRQELLAQILGLNGDIGIYAPAGQPLANYDDLSAQIRKIKGVTSAFPIVQGEVLLSGPQGGATGGIARGITQDGLNDLPTVSNHIVSGSLSGLTSTDTVAVGTGLAQQLSLTVGGTVTLILPQGKTTVIGTIPSIQSFKVAAIFQTGMQQYDTGFVFMPLAAAQTLFQQPNAATQIQVYVTDPDHDDPIKAALQNSLTTPVSIQDWRQNNDSFLAAVTVEGNVMFLILTLIILVAAFNVISSLIMMVKDKARDIAILRTMGASSGAVLRIFIMCGASVGILGTLIGFVIGTVFCAYIDDIRRFIQAITGTPLFDPTVYYLETLPAKLDWHEVMEILLMSCVLSLLATLYPSWRAAKIDPIEALRRE